MTARAWLDAFSAWLEARSTRERVLGLVTAAVALWAVASLTALDPLAARAAAHEAALVDASDRRDRLEVTREALETRAARSPEEEAQQELARLEREVAELDARVEAAGTGLLSPSQMNAALEALLARRPALRVIALETEASEPLLPEAAEEEGPRLHRHRGVLEMEGDWTSVQSALRELEALPWPLHWDELRYRVTEHPRARVTLRFHTLGTQPEWVGA